MNYKKVGEAVKKMDEEVQRQKDQFESKREQERQKEPKVMLDDDGKITELIEQAMDDEACYGEVEGEDKEAALFEKIGKIKNKPQVE
jgi:hypothetical protein